MSSRKNGRLPVTTLVLFSPIFFLALLPTILKFLDTKDLDNEGGTLRANEEQEKVFSRSEVEHRFLRIIALRIGRSLGTFSYHSNFWFQAMCKRKEVHKNLYMNDIFVTSLLMHGVIHKHMCILKYPELQTVTWLALCSERKMLPLSKERKKYDVGISTSKFLCERAFHESE